MTWHLKKFDELSAAELYAILRLRSEVFVVEQNCIFLDMDNIDQHCYHLFLMTAAGVVVATTRLVPAGISYEYCSIGRVVTGAAYRGQSLGKAIMEKSIAYCYELFGHGPIKIGAQLYLKKFYNDLGFQQCGAEYDEDGIIHIPMLLNK